MKSSGMILAIVIATIMHAPLAVSDELSQQQQDGTYFLRVCSAAVRQSNGEKLGIEESKSAFFCSSYVSGFIDGMTTTSGVTETEPPVCLPKEGISIDAAVRIFVQFLRDNPADLHQSGRILLIVSLREALPCK